MYIKVVEMKKGPSLSSIACPYCVAKMYSEQSYSRLFRPWDVCDKKPQELANCDSNFDEKSKQKIINDNKRESRLRKIRGTFRKSDPIHQDATVSTTTVDNDVDTKPTVNVDDSPVEKLTLCCDRLLQEPEEKNEKEKRDIPAAINLKPLSYEHHPQTPLTYNPHFIPDYLPTADIAHALGVPPTDPLLLESLAQGYAMELEYARILHQENEAKLNAKKQRPKKYKCPHCQVGFSNNGQLKGHIRIHTGERPYKCDEKNCGKTFTRNEELTRHKRIHSGVRPFPCSTCGKKFGRRDHLKKHTRTHFVQAERMMPVFVPLTAVPHMTGFPYLYGY